MMQVDALVIKRLVRWLNDPEAATYPSESDFEIGETLGLLRMTRATDGHPHFIYPKFIPVWEKV